MKKITIILLIPILILSCSTGKNTSKEKNSKTEINKLVKKLMINPGNQTNTQLLFKEYSLANKKDFDRIKKLRLSGQPDIWFDVYLSYSDLSTRQKKIEKLDKSVLNKINFRKRDYSDDLELARMKSANYLYAVSKVLIKNATDSACKLARRNLFKISTIYDNFRDVDKLLRKSLIYGSKNVLYRFYNNSEKVLPRYQENHIRSVQITENSFFDFDNKVIPGKEYDLSIVVNIEKINVFPGSSDKSSHFVSKGIKNESSKYRCKVYEIMQKKSVLISGNIEYYDNTISKKVYVKPIAVKTNFNYKYVRLKGDERACSPEVIELAKRKKIIYPSDNKMLEDAIVKLKSIVENVIVAD